MRAIQSVLDQTFEDFELIVVDDGSTDSTLELIQNKFGGDSGDPRLKVISQPNSGVSAARNLGVRHTSGQWLAFLDSDDYWKPEKLQTQLAATLRIPDCVASYTEEVWFRRGKWANPKKVHAKHSGWIFDQCLPLCIISPSSVMMAREVFDVLGGFDETLPACEDYDLWLRLSARYPVHLVEEKLIVKENGHEGQLSQLHWGLDRFRIRALWKISLDQGVEADKRVRALEWIEKKAAVVAGGAVKRGHGERAAIFNHSAAAARTLRESIRE